MAVSTIIVLAWWLQAPLDKVSEKLLGMPSVGIGIEWRAWFAALIAVLYFALRFRFSERQQDAVKELHAESSRLRDRLLIRWLRWEVTAWDRWRLSGPVIGQALDATVKSVIEMNGGDVVKVSPGEVSPGRTDDTGSRVSNSRIANACSRVCVRRHQHSSRIGHGGDSCGCTCGPQDTSSSCIDGMGGGLANHLFQSEYSIVRSLGGRGCRRSCMRMAHRTSNFGSVAIAWKKSVLPVAAMIS